ncbi:MAG TPA: hypothetical protein VK043_07855 [Burkholderiales bacterium]|nr:hypothetical protein [Burkholderiales bacterium]
MRSSISRREARNASSEPARSASTSTGVALPGGAPAAGAAAAAGASPARMLQSASREAGFAR